MNALQVRKYYEGKKNHPCELTKRLIQAGYQQDEGSGYMGYAKERSKTKDDIEVDYRKAEPNQWWHLIESYCERTEDNTEFTKTIQCGELIFWMAEVADCIDRSVLENLVERIIETGRPQKSTRETMPPVRYDRKNWNREIQNICFDSIVKAVEGV